MFLGLLKFNIFDDNIFTFYRTLLGSKMFEFFFTKFWRKKLFCYHSMFHLDFHVDCYTKMRMF